MRNRQNKWCVYVSLHLPPVQAACPVQQAASGAASAAGSSWVTPYSTLDLADANPSGQQQQHRQSRLFSIWPTHLGSMGAFTKSVLPCMAAVQPACTECPHSSRAHELASRKLNMTKGVQHHKKNYTATGASMRLDSRLEVYVAGVCAIFQFVSASSRQIFKEGISRFAQGTERDTPPQLPNAES